MPAQTPLITERWIIWLNSHRRKNLLKMHHITWNTAQMVSFSPVQICSSSQVFLRRWSVWRHKDLYQKLDFPLISSRHHNKPSVCRNSNTRRRKGRGLRASLVAGTIKSFRASRNIRRPFSHRRNTPRCLGNNKRSSCSLRRKSL